LVRATTAIFDFDVFAGTGMTSKTVVTKRGDRKSGPTWLNLASRAISGRSWVTLTAVSERRMREVHDGTSCAVAATSELIGSKWTALIVHDLSEGPRRFSELEHACPGISPRTLSERLHMLEEQGICLRASYPESPPRVEYELTDKGRSMLPIIEEMRTFGHEWLIQDHDHEHIDVARVAAL
jgi:DNA-binding HxlR family transcriptional regulator